MDSNIVQRISTITRQEWSGTPKYIYFKSIALTVRHGHTQCLQFYFRNRGVRILDGRGYLHKLSNVKGHKTRQKCYCCANCDFAWCAITFSSHFAAICRVGHSGIHGIRARAHHNNGLWDGFGGLPFCDGLPLRRRATFRCRPACQPAGLSTPADCCRLSPAESSPSLTALLRAMDGVHSRGENVPHSGQRGAAVNYQLVSTFPSLFFLPSVSDFLLGWV